MLRIFQNVFSIGKSRDNTSVHNVRARLMLYALQRNTMWNYIFKVKATGMAHGWKEISLTKRKIKCKIDML